jgi:NitT/TauT family transport system substrate-binding protein
MLKLGLGAALALVAGLASAAGALAQTISVGHLGIVADAPFYVGIEQGYFAKAGITVKLERFASAAQATLPLSTGEVQVAGGGLSAGLFNAFARGLPIRIAMARTRDTDGFSSDTLSVREDLSGTVKTLADLKGRKIAVNAPAGALEYMVGKMLEAGGLGFKDADVTYMSWPDMGAGFSNKGIDLGAVVEPFTTQYAERKLAVPFRNAAQVLKDPPLEVSVILFNKTWIDRSPDQVRAFSKAYLEGVRDYYDAMRGGPKRAELVDILAKYTALKDKALYDRITWSYMDPNAEISIASLKDQQDWYAKRGAVEHTVDVDAMLDLRFRDEALKTLGRVTVK